MLKLEEANRPSKSAPPWNPEVGESISGTIVASEYVETVPPWDKAITQLKLKVTVATDDGEWAIWTTQDSEIGNKDGKSKNDYVAIVDAMTAAGVEGIEEGGVLEMTRLEDIPTKRGHGAKAFTATYRPPDTSADVSDLAGTGLG